MLLNKFAMRTAACDVRVQIGWHANCLCNNWLNQ